ncbi:telomerase reverse transcriptase [Diachasma alloeum]|uniref:telomerase reverse transcriptase n=1 Tax=Diachasma alloeum TaxID=454923 RepID=UPI0007384D63|nr:telomerase reverse transcriptase [Diachasma alloeum]
MTSSDNETQGEFGYLKELEESDFDLIQLSFGEEIRKVLERGSINVKKTIIGGYFISSAEILRQCRRYLLEKDSKTKKFEQRDDDTDSMSHEERAFVEQHIDDATADDLHTNLSASAIDDSDPETLCYKPKIGGAVARDEKRRKKEHPENISVVVFPKHHMWNQTERKGWLTSIFKNCNDFAQPCLPALEPIMQNFALNHAEFKYFYIINSLTNQAKPRFQVEMPENALRKFFSMIIGVVAPRDLFGSLGNVKAIQKGTLNYIFSIRREFFQIGSITENLDLNAIGWLEIIDDMKTKARVMKTFVSWFLSNYIKIIVNNYFYQVSMKHDRERILIPVKTWIKYRDDFIHELIDGTVLEESSYLSSDGIPLAFVKFHVKSDGLRPIYEPIPTNDQKNESLTLNQLLKQAWALKSEDFHESKLYSFWEPIVKAGKKNGKPMYFVTADVSDAYGSIIQDKVLEMVRGITEKLPETLTLTTFDVLVPKYGFQYLKLEKQFYDKSLPLLFSSGKVAACHGHSPSSKHVTSKMMERITCYVMNQTVVIGNTGYRLNRGVGQGLSLSSILANIYYGTMEMEEFQEFRQDGWLVRYVDDFLYVTDNKESAERFLARIRAGIPKYNCYFKPSKTHTNLSPFSETNFTFLGFKFNIATFEVQPDYSSRVTQFNTTVEIVDESDEAKTFNRRLLNMQVLKLNKIVLNRYINSEEQIINTMLAAAKRLAHKCRILVTHMLVPDLLNGSMICDSIGESISRLAVIFRKHWDKENKQVSFPTQRIWQKFIDEFQRYKKLADQLTPILRKKKESVKKPKVSRKRKRSITDDEQNDRRFRIKL